ncbi:MAG: hypothetical protein ACXAAO_02440 [Candidatus Thorarchaeota archaeon]|jgi:hypothetical protein
MSKEKFVRDKPHVNIGIFIVVLAIFVALTYVLPQQIPPGNIAFPVESVLRPDFVVLLTQSLVNGAVYGIVGVIGFQAISRARIPKHNPEWTN